MEKILEKIKALWDRLPAEVKVGIYYAGAVAMNDIVAWLSDSASLDLGIVLRVFIANIILVFVKEIQPRVAKLQS